MPSSMINCDRSGMASIDAVAISRLRKVAVASNQYFFKNPSERQISLKGVFSSEATFVDVTCLSKRGNNDPFYSIIIS